SYVALEAELPNPGDFKTTYVGEAPVVVVRDREGDVGVLLNRCAHRGARVCRSERGNSAALTCLYHQWSYDLRGNLIGVPFRKGVREDGALVGGMPGDSDPCEHGLERLKVTAHNGVVFASFEPSAPPLAEYLGPLMLRYFERVFDGRPLYLLGKMRQKI